MFNPSNPHSSDEAVTSITVVHEGREFTVRGREAWALGHLVAAGDKGCTPIDQPAPRWSHYVWFLRHDRGIDIETVDEPHGGPFKGHHARYVLRSPLTVLKVSMAGEARHAA